MGSVRMRWIPRLDAVEDGIERCRRCLEANAHGVSGCCKGLAKLPDQSEWFATESLV